MTTTITTRFNVGDIVYVPTFGMNGKVYEGKVHMVRAEWHPYGFDIQYDIYLNDKTIEEPYCQGWDESHLGATEEEARTYCK